MGCLGCCGPPRHPSFSLTWSQASIIVYSYIRPVTRLNHFGPSAFQSCRNLRLSHSRRRQLLLDLLAQDLSRLLHVPIDCGASTFLDQFSTGLPSPPLSDHGGPTTQNGVYSLRAVPLLSLWHKKLSQGNFSSLTIHDREEDGVFSPASLFLSSKQYDSFTDVQPSQLSDLLSFPLSPPKVHPDFKTKRATNEKKATKSNRRYLSAEALTPSTIPDR